MPQKGSRLENRGLQVLLRGSFSPGMRELGLLAMDLFGTLSGQGDPLVASLIAFSFHYWSRNLWVGSLMLRNQMMTTTVPSKLSQLPQSFLYLFKFSLLFIADAYNTGTAPFLRDRLKVNLKTSVRKRKAF